MRVAIYQSDIEWENPEANCKKVETLLQKISSECDLLVLPEMFNTGFTMSPNKIAEQMDGQTVEFIQRCATQYNTAIMCSLIIEEHGKHYNRLIFATSDKPLEYYDKRHLFRMSGEHNHFSEGTKRVIFEYMGFRILPQVCYDLRFPVWSRNIGQQYDIAVYVASWPTPRVKVWDILLQARALENQCYVVGVNRVGNDPATSYCGMSSVVDFLGRKITSTQPSEECYDICTLDIDKLNQFREKFPAYLDADNFSIEL